MAGIVDVISHAIAFFPGGRVVDIEHTCFAKTGIAAAIGEVAYDACPILECAGWIGKVGNEDLPVWLQTHFLRHRMLALFDQLAGVPEVRIHGPVRQIADDGHLMEKVADHWIETQAITGHYDFAVRLNQDGLGRILAADVGEHRAAAIAE